LTGWAATGFHGLFKATAGSLAAEPGGNKAFRNISWQRAGTCRRVEVL